MRVFIALALPELMRAGAARAARSLAALYPGLAVPRSDGLHVTLFFFGERDEAEVGLIRAALLAPSWNMEAFTARFSGLGAFPPAGPVRVVFAGFGKGTERIIDCRERLGRALRSAGIEPPEEGRPFHPHLTLGRNKSDRIDRRALSGIALPADDFTVHRCVLFQSILERSGAVYRPLAERAPAGRPE